MLECIDPSSEHYEVRIFSLKPLLRGSLLNIVDFVAGSNRISWLGFPIRVHVLVFVLSSNYVPVGGDILDGSCFCPSAFRPFCS